MKHRIALAGSAVVVGLVLAGCSGGDTTRGASNDEVDTDVADLCVPFQGDVEPNKTPAPTPAGDPSQQATLNEVKKEILSAVTGVDKTAQYCSEGVATLENCDVAYWQDSYSQAPAGIPTQSCNFFYLRVSDDFWHEPTRIAIDEYGDYLGLHADGTDPENYSVGPHTTLVQQGNADTFYESDDRGPYLQIQLSSDGQMSGDTVNTAVNNVIAATDGSGGTPQPVLANDQMTPDCANVWEYRSTDPKAQPVANTPVQPGQQFLCALRTKDQGTGYVRITLGDLSDDKTSVGASFDIQQAARTDQLLRKPNGPQSFAVENLVWPVATPEVQNRQTEQVTIPQECADDGGATDQTSCVHLWITSGKAPYTETGCKIWLTLEIDKTGVEKTLGNYQVDTSSLTPHISLAKSQRLKKSQAQICQRAADLNKQSGLPANGAPPASLA